MVPPRRVEPFKERRDGFSRCTGPFKKGKDQVYFSPISLFAYNSMPLVEVFPNLKKSLTLAFCSPQLTKFMDPDPH